MTRKQFRFMPQSNQPTKGVDVWLVLGIKKIGATTDFTFLESYQDNPRTNQRLIAVFPDEAQGFDYVIVIRAEEAEKRGWMKRYHL